jgi:hypothetical protein
VFSHSLASNAGAGSFNRGIAGAIVASISISFVIAYIRIDEDKNYSNVVNSCVRKNNAAKPDRDVQSAQFRAARVQG